MLLIAEIERCKTNEAGTVRSEKMRSWLRCLKKLNVLLPLPEFLISTTKSFEPNVLQVVTIFCVLPFLITLRQKFDLQIY